MSMMTDRELEFLVGLRTSWRRLYWDEVVHLLRVGGQSSEGSHPGADLASGSVRSRPGLVPSDRRRPPASV